VKILTGKNLSVLKAETKKSTRAPSEPGLDTAISKKAETSSSIVRHSGLDRIVRLVRDSAEQAGDPRVEEIKLAIQEGRYEISTDEIADAIIRETLTISGIEE
jgi:flagellar biosynthesis anti-sigma factor FlgM